jgi:proline iminopeptidase
MAEAKLAPNLPDWMLEHANRYLSSGGTDGHMYKVTVPQHGELTVPALLLTTTGRKSGESRELPLIYGVSGDDYLIVASKGGADAPPAWYLNLKDNPEVEVQVWGDRFTARARDATAEEKPEMWKTMTAEWPAYDDYQKKTDRQIPVVVLERA